MSNEGISQPRRSRGRPKKSVNYATLAGFTTLNRPSNFPIKRKQTEEVDEIQILSTNGIEITQPKKSKAIDDAPKRSQPHRAARFTESYGGSPDVVIVSDEEAQEESESESDSECSPIPSPVCKVKTKEEIELWESNVQRLKKQLNDEEMKLVLLLKLKDSQKVKEPKTEANGSPLPSVTSFNNQKSLPVAPVRNSAQQPLPNKQLIANKYLPVKKEGKPNPIAMTNSDLQRRASPSPVALVKNETNSSSVSATQSSAQLKSNTLNQYPLLKNLSNQITVTPVPAASSPVPVINKPPPEEKIDAQTIYQRQATAKLQLRKQLEKTLLQIPLPKPPL